MTMFKILYRIFIRHCPRVRSASGGRLNSAHCDRVRACEDEGTVGKSNNKLRARSGSEGRMSRNA